MAKAKPIFPQKHVVVLPYGALGAGPDDDELEELLRDIATAFGHDGEWAEKYGTDVDNEVFSMHRYCWCESEACPWCREDRAPNFHFKPSGLKVWWYKYIGRGMRVEGDFPPGDLQGLRQACLAAKKS